MLILLASLMIYDKLRWKSPMSSDPSLTVMDMVIFRTIFFQLLVFFMFTLLTLHFAY